MNKIIIIVFFTITTMLSSSISAEDRFSLGAGVGLSYTGLGLNLAQQSDKDLTYISAGCISYSSLNGSTCGFGLGWITTRFFDGNPKHALGAYYGVIGTDRSFLEDKAVHGLGVGYYYFFNGIDKQGTNIGISLVSGTLSDSSNSGNAIILQLGYQF
ncbi:MAG: hypothetical protein Q9M92_02420 [Enterobacterales bacterium]|nr:hypothetical protein [Enterobacterales bacterium]